MMNKTSKSAIALALLACCTLSFAAVHGAVPASAPAGHAKTSATKPGPPASAKPLIDINSASREQLKTLPGIGDAQAERIIGGRPYLSKTDLVATKAIPTGTYLSIKRSIIAKQPNTPSKTKGS